MRQMLKSNVRFKDGGATSYAKALAIAAREASLKKTTRASEFGFSLFERFGPKEAPDPQDTVDWSILNEAELLILSSFFCRALGLPPEQLASNPLRVAVETGEGLFRVAKGIDGHLDLERASVMQRDSEGAPTAASG